MNNSNFTYLKSGVDIEKTTNLVKFIPNCQNQRELKEVKLKTLKI